MNTPKISNQSLTLKRQKINKFQTQTIMEEEKEINNQIDEQDKWKTEYIEGIKICSLEILDNDFD